MALPTRLFTVVFVATFLVPLAIFCLGLLLAWVIDPEGGKSVKQEKKERAPGEVWEEFKLYGGFFQFFLDFGLKANVFFYGITGVIITILYNSNAPGADKGIKERLGTHVAGLLIGTPLVIGVMLGLSFLAGAFLWWRIVRDVTRARKSGEISLTVRPYLNYLTWMLALFGGVFLLVSYGLYGIMCDNKIYICA